MGIKCCPIETALKYIGKKWSVNIIRDLFLGRKRFKDFLEANPHLSTKMLSERLKELEKNGIIEKKIVSTTPVTIEYTLTTKGMSLNKILYEMARFSGKECAPEVFNKKMCPGNFKMSLKKAFHIT